MAGARADNNEASTELTYSQLLTEAKHVEFLNIRDGYFPGEAILLTYTSSTNIYKPTSKDFIALYKCGSKTSPELNPYRWPASTKSYAKIYKTKLGLPNPDRRQKTNEYQFVYVSHDQNRVVGRSRVFKISDIIELDNSRNFGDLDTSLNVVDKELFELKATNPLPVKLYDVNRQSVFSNPTVGVQADPHAELSAELRNALNSAVSTDSILRVAELIKQYEQVHNIPQSSKIKTNKNKTQTPKHPTHDGQIFTQVDKNSNRPSVNPQMDDNVDLLLLERFVFPYISGVLEHLNKNGFSRIVCRNNQVVLLGNTSGRTLDLRYGWQSLSQEEIKQLAQSPDIDVNALFEKVNQLAIDLEMMKQLSDARHAQAISEMETLKVKVDKMCEFTQTHDNSSLIEANRALLTTIEVLQSRLNETTEEYEVLSKLFASQACCLQHNDSIEILRRNAPNWKRVKNKDRQRRATNTERVHMKEEGASAEPVMSDKHTATSAPRCRPPAVQKATSYAAATSRNVTSTTHDDKKHTATSDRALSSALTKDQQSFIRLLQKLLNSEKANKQSQTLDNADSSSSESLAVAMKRLFNMSSTPSLASTNSSWHSARSVDSVMEAFRSLFGSESSTTDLPKTNSYPATPCNSADSITRQKMPENLRQATSMREVLRRLLNASEQKTPALSAPPVERESSLWSLGEAMIKAFREDISCTDIENKCNLSTSNESLSQAMHWLFDTLSQHDLRDNSTDGQPIDSDSSTSSLGSVLLWALTDPTPEEYEGVDVKVLNDEKRNKRKMVDCECHNRVLGGSKDKKHPSLSSVIRASSPDRDVNIAFPSISKQAKMAAVSTGNQQEKDIIPETSKFTFSSSVDSSPMAAVLEAARVSGSPLKVNTTQTSKRTSRSARRRSKALCPHCGITIQSRTAAQTNFRMNRHMRLHHRIEESLDG